MKKDGYFISCNTCGSYEVKELEAMMNAKANMLVRTFECEFCGKVAKENI